MSVILSNKFQQKKKNPQFQCKIYKPKKSHQKSLFVLSILLYDAAYKAGASRVDCVSKLALLCRPPACLWTLSCMCICHLH